MAEQAVAATIVRHYDQLSDADRAVALATLTSHPTQGRALLEAVGAGSFDKKNLTALHVRQLRNLRDPGVDVLLDKVWGKSSESPAELMAAAVRYKSAYAVKRHAGPAVRRRDEKLFSNSVLLATRTTVRGGSLVQI